MVARILRADGFEALQACCAEEAIGILQQLDELPQAIITDVDMPGTSVMRLVDEARRSKPSIPILLVSGGHDNLELATAVRRGDLHLLPKPFKGAQLLEWLRRQVELRAE